ncbi:MAG: GGDEF domain-containing protein [bacterium]|nr:GGDEF domain-containing protein [bacterium]
MNKKILFILVLLISALMVILLVLRVKGAVLFVSLALLVNFILTLQLSRGALASQEDHIADLKFKLNDLLNELGKDNVDPQLLEDMYVKSIKLFQTLVTDKETGTVNEKHFKSLFQNEINRSVRYNKTFSLLLIKILNHKEFKEGLNYLLKKVASVIKGFMRDVDVLGRYRDENLILLLPETGIKGANTVGERIITYSKNIRDEQGNPFNLLLSIGISVCPINGKNVDVLINASEKNIANADRLGGNQVIFNAE